MIWRPERVCLVPSRPNWRRCIVLEFSPEQRSNLCPITAEVVKTLACSLSAGDERFRTIYWKIRNLPILVRPTPLNSVPTPPGAQLITPGHHLSSAKQAYAQHLRHLSDASLAEDWQKIVGKISVLLQSDSSSQSFCGALSRSLLLISLGARRQNAHRAILSHHWLSYLICQVRLSLHLHSFIQMASRPCHHAGKVAAI